MAKLITLSIVLLQIFALLISFGLNESQKFDVYGRPKCCGDSVSPSYLRAKSWEDTLRDAAYQSIIHHFDYPGTLDGRLDRDQKLWKHLQEARFTLKNNYLFGDTEEDTKSGILIMKRLSDQSFGFEFQQTDNLNLDCSMNDCELKNSSLLASWKVNKKGDENGMNIRVKLPVINEKRTEDVYEYSIQSGLKKVNPNPIEHNSFSAYRTNKEHRFANIPRTTKSGFKSYNNYKGGFPGFDESTETRFQSYGRVKSGYRNSERMDFRFGSPGKGNFGTGRIIPTSFMYDTPFYSSEESDEGWTRFQTPRQPYPSFKGDVGFRNVNEGSLFGSNSPYHSRLPEDYYELQQQTPPQRPEQESNGFLPSVGPINAPPSYRTEYVYDPRYRLTYGNNQHMMTPSTFTTTSSKPFKPSTEYVRYSELDPFYHPDDTQELLLTTPKTNVGFESPKTSSVSLPATEKLTTNNPIEKTTLFQIIVDNMKNNTETITYSPPITSQASITNLTTEHVSQTITPTSDRPHKIPANKVHTKAKDNPSVDDFNAERAFGEKIIPKSRTTVKPKSALNKIKPTLKHKTVLDFSTRAEPLDEEVKQRKATTVRIPERFTTQHESTQKENHRTTNNIENKKKDFNESSTTSLDKLTEENKFTQNIDVTTKSYYETTTEFNQKDDSTIVNFKDTTLNSDFPTTSLWDDVKKTIIPKNTDLTASILNITESDTIPTNSDNEFDTKADHTTRDMTEHTTEISTPDSNSYSENGFFTAMTNFFMPETTTKKNDKKDTEMTTVKADADAETQESKQHKTHYRLLTFPGDPVSIVANRISKSISYRTANGKERKLPSKLPFSSRYKFSDLSKEYRSL